MSEPWECVLAPASVTPINGECVWCGETLTGRRRRWCSDVCGDTYWRSHDWGAARNMALWRVQVKGLHGWYCDQCRTITTKPEVNHVEPRIGRGYDKGCHNHQTNLQVLCHDCHVAETARQKRERIAGIWPGLEPKWRQVFGTWREAAHYIETGTRSLVPQVEQEVLGLTA